MTWQILTKFQFHKVRLKGMGQKKYNVGDIVFQFHKVRLKACFRQAAWIRFRTFQFHKVRLKGVYFVIRFESELFQFHKVRLKAMLVDLVLTLT